jgi:OCT family organic cation transporter-like MFS transporter 4/5
MQLLQKTVNKEQELESSAKKQRWKLFRRPALLKQLAKFTFAWFTSAFIYYGLSFNMKNVSGNPYLNVFFLGMVDFPGELSGIIFSNR